MATINVPQCPVCGSQLPPQKAGRPRRYCSDRCSKAASRARRSGWAAGPGAPDADAQPVEAFLVGHSAPTDEQVLGAVHEALLLAAAFRRLSREARPQFAWRCAKVADVLDDVLERRFPTT